MQASSDAYYPADDPTWAEGGLTSQISALYRGSLARERSPEGAAAVREAKRRRDFTPVAREAAR